jgi:hypothetical protein
MWQSSAFFAKLVGENQQLGVYVAWLPEKEGCNLFERRWTTGWILHFQGLVFAVEICC